VYRHRGVEPAGASRLLAAQSQLDDSDEDDGGDHACARAHTHAEAHGRNDYALAHAACAPAPDCAGASPGDSPRRTAVAGPRADQPVTAEAGEARGETGGQARGKGGGEQSGSQGGPQGRSRQEAVGEGSSGDDRADRAWSKDVRASLGWTSRRLIPLRATKSGRLTPARPAYGRLWSFYIFHQLCFDS